MLHLLPRSCSMCFDTFKNCPQIIPQTVPKRPQNVFKRQSQKLSRKFVPKVPPNGGPFGHRRRSKSSPEAAPNRPRRPHSRPNHCKSSKMPPRGVQELPRAPQGRGPPPPPPPRAALNPRPQATFADVPCPRALAPASQARRNARERLNPPSHLPACSGGQTVC